MSDRVSPLLFNPNCSAQFRLFQAVEQFCDIAVTSDHISFFVVLSVKLSILQRALAPQSGNDHGESSFAGWVGWEKPIPNLLRTIPT